MNAPHANPRVLLIDDDQDFLEVASERLSHSGFDVVATSDVRVVWKSLADGAHPLSAIVCDVQMPDESGTGLVSRIRASGSNIPVILITGHFDIDSEAARALGVNDVMTKPFDMASLVKRIEDQLRKAA
jgi:DNA-binding response OmpR family regulator